MNWIIESILVTLLVWLMIALILGVIMSNIYQHSFFFAWYDFWIGIYYDRHKKIIYIIPFPCVVFSFDINKKKGKNET